MGASGGGMAVLLAASPQRRRPRHRTTSLRPSREGSLWALNRAPSWKRWTGVRTPSIEDMEQRAVDRDAETRAVRKPRLTRRAPRTVPCRANGSARGNPRIVAGREQVLLNARMFPLRSSGACNVQGPPYLGRPLNARAYPEGGPYLAEGAGWYGSLQGADVTDCRRPA